MFQHGLGPFFQLKYWTKTFVLDGDLKKGDVSRLKR